MPQTSLGYRLVLFVLLAAAAQKRLNLNNNKFVVEAQQMHVVVVVSTMHGHIEPCVVVVHNDV